MCVRVHVCVFVRRLIVRVCVCVCVGVGVGVCICVRVCNPLSHITSQLKRMIFMDIPLKNRGCKCRSLSLSLSLSLFNILKNSFSHLTNPNRHIDPSSNHPSRLSKKTFCKDICTHLHEYAYEKYQEFSSRKGVREGGVGCVCICFLT